MPTIKVLSERVLRHINAGDRAVGSSIHAKEVEDAIRQSINALLHTQYFKETLPGGETVPEGCVLATYASVPVTAWNGISKSILPAIPIKLPRNIGVFHIGITTNVFCRFIPMRRGEIAQVKTQKIMSDLLGQHGYEVAGKEIWYDKDLTALSTPITAVMIQLVVMDLSLYTDYDLLPIDAEMEQQVVMDVLKLFSVEQPTPEIATSVTDNRLLKQ
jgi:hypothetical protein